MSSPDVLSSLLSSLPPRPPTPPREVHHDGAAAPANKPSVDSIDTRLSVHTPPGFQSPASSLTTNSTSRRIRKRVGFSAQAEYKDPPVYPEGAAAQQHPTPVSLPRSASKPVKSILKVTNHAPNPLDSTAGITPDAPSPHVNLVAMLESTIQQLAGGDRDSKLDAYLMLTRAWKASNNLPDRVALQEKMSLFTQFMQRDIMAKTPGGSLDSSLVHHALNLLTTFLHFPAIASTIPSDFGVFVIDHCIRSFEDASTPKDTARRLMQVISLQNFSPKVMTPDRVGRLVLSLHSIEEHLKGKSIVLSRVIIYRKLVRQSRQLMVLHSDWLLDLFTDMLSNLKEIRSAAVALGLEAAFSIGHEKHLSRKAIEVFNLSHEDTRYIQFYAEKLSAMTRDKHESAVVPEIWSVVLLLLRIPLEKWDYAGPWLHVIQSCFNSTDFPTKIAANRAWGRLVYFMQLEEKTFGRHLPTLTTPLVSQLRRRGAGKTSDELRQAVLGGVCNLFYYAFKPNTSSTLLDSYWDSTVKPVFAKLLEPAGEYAEDNLRQASAILGGLFDCTTPRRWRADRIVDAAFVKPEELPPIDAKWIRHNTKRVFAIVAPILEQDFCALAGSESGTYRLWRTLVSTIASAAAKEIKVSRDTASFVTEALNLLHRLWKRGSLDSEEAKFSRVEFLLAVKAYLEVMIGELGLLPFTEKASKHQASTKVPLFSLFSMLSTLPPGVSDDKEFADFFNSVFAPFFASKGDKARMDLAQDLLSTIPMDAPRPYAPWLLVAGAISSWLGPGHSSHHSTGSGNETPVGHDYRDIVKVLERGIRSTPGLPLEHWESLFGALLERVRDETGDAGVAIVVIEPLAKVLLDQFAPQGTVDARPSCVRYVTELVSVSTQPRDRLAVDAARKRLWGTVLAGSRSSSFDTFDHLYKAVNEALKHSYDTFDSTDTDSVVSLLKEIGGFFDRCNRQLFSRSMVALEDGFIPWLQDNKRLLSSQTSSALSATKSLWDKLSCLITELEHPEQQMHALERFFRASFASCHRSIVNSSISLWNRLFENVQHLDYPEQLKAALVQMQAQLHAEIVLPGLEMSSVECAGQQRQFIDSFDDFSLPKLPSTTSNSRRETPRPVSPQSTLLASAKLAMPGNQRANMPPEMKANRRNRTPRPAPPRPRHDDSQVEFAAIPPSLDSPIESQVLTERQKEVWERQRENAGLFREIRSSPGVRTRASTRNMLLASSRARQATPEAERTFNDYVSSTPTPRRGQAVLMPETDLTDPPSSPPVPRGNPLAAEIRSRPVNQSLLEEWPFSSSPLSGSPNPNRQGVVPDSSSQRGHVSVVSLSEVEGLGQSPDEPLKSSDKANPEAGVDEVIEDSMIFEQVGMTPVRKASGSPVTERPTTPRRSARLSRLEARETTPKSDGEVFVDAPTSPLPPSPKQASKFAKAAQPPDTMPAAAVDAGNPSFDFSDLDEGSLLRLVVELDSAKVDPSEYQRPSVSPLGKVQGSPPSLDCIVVGEGPEMDEEHDGRVRSSQVRNRRGRPKRKRAPSKAGETSTLKRQRQESAEGPAEVLNSQASQVSGTDVEIDVPQQGPIVKGEDVKQEDHEERIPSSSAEPSDSGSLSDERDDSQDAALVEAANAMDIEGDDYDVQSQIALESFCHSQRQQEEEESEVSAPDAIPALEEELVQVDAAQKREAMEEEGKEEDEAAVDSTAAPANVVLENSEVDNQDRDTPESPSQAQRIIALFRGGLEALRSARLSRQEVYQIEDLFMDMKRELYEAERRGRT
ncbi:hypothetical protein VTK26DRAFT_4158 [Humicola hyalothermophila]